MSSTKHKKFQTKNWFVYISIVVMICIGLAASILFVRSYSVQTVQTLLYNEMHSTAATQAEIINKETKDQFVPLYTLTEYIKNKEDFLSASNQQTLEAIKREHHFCVLGFADQSGEAVNYNGEVIGDISGRQYYAQIMSKEKTQVVEYLETTLKSEEPRFMFSIPVYDGEELSGVLFASKEVSVISDVLLGDTLFDGSERIFITDANFNVLAANEKGAQAIEQGDLPDNLLNGEDSATGNAVYVTDIPVGVNQWLMVCVLDKSNAEAIYYDITQFLKDGVNAITFILVAVLLFVLLMAYKRITWYRRGELAELEERLHDAQLKNSISQMQPHFLYNALASIREIVLVNPQYAADLIYDFSLHLRACIRALSHDELVPFEQELDNINAYLNIEKMRFGDKLHVHEEIADKDFLIVPLSIQPLVENAVRHGIYERGAKGGSVTITTELKDGTHVIRVSDDGVGFDYEAMLKEIEEHKRDSTGLTNLTFRLKKIMNADVIVESTPDVGSVITVRIPAKREENPREDNCGRR